MNKATIHLRSLGHALLSAALFGFMSYAVYRMCGHAKPSQLALIRALASTALLTPVVLKDLPSVIGPHCRSLWIRAIAGAASILCYFWTLQHGDIGESRLYSDLFPIFVLLIAVIFYKERLRTIEVLGIAVVVAAVALLNLESSATHSGPEVLITGITGSFCMGISLTALKQATKHFSANLIVWALGVAVAALSATWALADWHPIATADLPWIAATAISAMFAQIFRTLSFATLKSPVASALSLSIVFFNVLFLAAFEGIWPTPQELFIYSIAFAGLLLTTLSRKEQT